MYTLKQLKNTFTNIICLNFSINGIGYGADRADRNEGGGTRIGISGGNTFGRQSDNFDKKSITLNQGGKSKIEKKKENMYSFELKLGDNFNVKIHNLATSLGLIPGDDHADFYNSVMIYFGDYLNNSLISETGKIRAGDELLYLDGYVKLKRNGQQLNFVKISNKLISTIGDDLGFQQNEEKVIVNKTFNKEIKQISGGATIDLTVLKDEKEIQILGNKKEKLDEQILKKGNEHLLDGIFKDGLGMNNLDLGKLSGDLSEYEQSYMLSVMQKDLHIGKLIAGAKKREQIIRSMEKADLIKIVGGTEIIFNTKNAIENLKFVPNVETLKESFGADVYKGSLESVVLVQLYLNAKGANISIDGKIGDETFDAITEFHALNGTFANNLKIKKDDTFIEEKVEKLTSIKLDKRDIDAGLFEFPVGQLEIHLNELFKKQKLLVGKKKSKKKNKNTPAIATFPGFIELSAIENTLNNLKGQIVLFKKSNKISNFKLISTSIDKLKKDVNAFEKKEPKADSKKLKTWTNSLISVVKDLKDKYIGITYEDAQEIIDTAFIDKKIDILLAAKSLKNSLPGNIPEKQLELMIISDLKKQIGSITTSLSILGKLTKRELENQINNTFDQKIIEITTQIANREHKAKVSLSGEPIRKKKILAIKPKKGIGKMYASKIKNRERQRIAKGKKSYEVASIGAIQLANFLKKEGYPKYRSGTTCGANVGEALLAMKIPGLPTSGRDGYKWTDFLESNPNFIRRSITKPSDALPGEILVYNKGYGRTRARQDYGHVEIKTFDGYFHGGYPKQRAGGSTRSGFTGYAYSPIQS